MAMQPNMVKMFEIIDEVFSTRNDPDQLQVTPIQQKKLAALHPATLSELADENGPLIWVLVIPTTQKVMDQFLKASISENELLNLTSPEDKFECIYLCSATTLPSERGKGRTKKLCVEAIRRICASYSIKSLFVWPFTPGGDHLAEAVAAETRLSLFKRTIKGSR
jgi:hypothetical protein